MSFQLSILTPDGTAFEGEADALVAPGHLGSFGVLPRHAPMLTLIGTGILRVEQGGGRRFFVLEGGVAEIRPDRISILADVAHAVEDAADAEERLHLLQAPERTGAPAASASRRRR